MRPGTDCSKVGTDGHSFSAVFLENAAVDANKGCPRAAYHQEAVFRSKRQVRRKKQAVWRCGPQFFSDSVEQQNPVTTSANCYGFALSIKGQGERSADHRNRDRMLL